MSAFILFALLVSFIGRSLSAQLVCHSSACPGSVVTCECAEAVGLLRWTVQPGSDCNVEYRPNRMPIGAREELCDNGSYSAVLESSSATQEGLIVFASSLNITLMENMTVTCTSTFGPEEVVLHVASKYVIHKAVAVL